MQGTTEIVDRLRADGFQVNVGYVRYLLSDRWMPMPARGPGGCLIWSSGDIDRLRSVLLRRGRGPVERPQPLPGGVGPRP